ncbi:hypothetical protein, partial [Halorubrum distributum]|uniref:hypothetical protein n=1 Tax=Halorubrum distributum TaxID=29283 RepID=UPI001955337B
MSSSSQSNEEIITLQERTETDLSDQSLTEEDYAALDKHDHVSSVSITSEKVKIKQHIGHICSIENAVRERDHSVLVSFLRLLRANERMI